MHKKSVQSALDKYMLRQLKKTSAPKRTNQKPEKELERAIKPVLISLGIFATVVESKAVYSKAAGRYMSGQTVAGFPDIVALNNQGQFLAIELKAQGRRSTVRPAQFDFLMRVISQNGFACVCDSVDHFLKIYSAWQIAPDICKKSILLKDMPKPGALSAKSNDVVDPDFGF